MEKIIPKFSFNEIDENLIQIYGEVNGWARRIFTQNRYCYAYDFQLIKNKKLYKFSYSENNPNSTKEKLWNYIIEKYNKAE